MPTAQDLPQPSASAQAHSQQLTDHLHALIAQQGGKLSFRDFMEQLMFAPGLGYYAAGSHKLGEAGDFVTAPEISPLFARTLARAIIPALAELPNPAVLEAGAGTGIMAAGILQELADLDALPEHYYLLELSGDLRDRQRQTLQEKVPALLSRVVWLDTLPAQFSGVILGNEVLDAMPVNLVTIQNGELQERYVASEENGFHWQDAAPSDPRLADRIKLIQEQNGEPLPEGYLTEINLTAEDWITTLAHALQEGLVLLIDYGFPRHEYYHPQRSTGTLMCHYRHHAHPDPFQYIGLQDVTAHVDFTAMTEAAWDAGLSIAGYTSQGNFLLGSGLAELAAEVDPNDIPRQLQVAGELKKLTLPHEMGELFKAIGFSKGLDCELPGFMLRDQRNYL